jgi:hypothetical protein
VIAFFVIVGLLAFSMTCLSFIATLALTERASRALVAPAAILAFLALFSALVLMGELIP